MRARQALTGTGGALLDTNTNVQEEPGSSPVQRLRGIATVNLWADDLEAARGWYTEMQGLPPYFERPGDVEFRVGDDSQELGLIDRRYVPEGFASGPGDAVVDSHMADLETTLEWLWSLGARPLKNPNTGAQDSSRRPSSIRSGTCRA